MILFLCAVTIGFNRTDNSMVSESMVTIQFPVCILSGSLMENEHVNLNVDWVFGTASKNNSICVCVMGSISCGRFLEY